MNELGRQAYRDGNYAKALELFEQANALSPDQVYEKNIALVRKAQRQDEADTLADRASAAWKNRDWATAIHFYRLAMEKYPEEPSYLNNINRARTQQQQDAATAARQKRRDEAKMLAALAANAWKNRDWDAAMELYTRAAEKFPENESYLHNVAAARENQQRDTIEIPRRKSWDEATAQYREKDYLAAVRLYLQAQALRNEPALERNLTLALKGLGRQFLHGVPVEYSGWTPRATPVGPSDKADALFKLRVEKAFADQTIGTFQSTSDPTYGDLQSMKERSGFVFDEGRVTTPALLPSVNESASWQVAEAITQAKAALILPRSSIERPDAPTAVKESRRLNEYKARSATTAERLNTELQKRAEIYRLGANATPQEVKENVDAISRLTYEAAIDATLSKGAGGSKDMELNLDYEEIAPTTLPASDNPLQHDPTPTPEESKR